MTSHEVSGSRRLLVALTIGFAATGLLAVSTAAPAGAATSPFARQAAAAGLNSQQAQQLQNEVAAYAVQTGGQQVSANRVDFAGGNVTVPLPGQQYARDISSPNSASSCGVGDFCAYSKASYTGSKKEYYICQDTRPFTSGTGSAYNNQTGGANATFYVTSGGDTASVKLAPKKGIGVVWSAISDVRTCP